MVVGRAAGDAAFFRREFEGFFAVELGLANEFFDAVGERLRGICLSAGIGVGFRANEERDLAPCRSFLE